MRSPWPLSVNVGQTERRCQNDDTQPSDGDRLRWIIGWAGTVVNLAASRVASALIALLLTALLGPAAAQSPAKVPRVGYISPGSSSDPARLRRFEAFRQGLRELGYIEGQTIILEPRWAEGKYDQYPALAADLVRLKVDAIVASGGAATKAAQQATRTIPIIMSIVIDPVGSGLVSSLAHPGGNLTGTSMMATDLVGKQFEVLKEIVPTVSRLALLWNPANPGGAPQLREAEAVARALGMGLQTLEARNPQEIDSAFAAMTKERPGALVVLVDAFFTNQVRQIADLATKGRLPSIYGQREYAEAGGLMVYSSNPFDMERRTATFVDKILKGAKPADLPIEQPTKFELLINLRTAKAIGVTIPPSLLQRADQIID
jgi:putative tryptophan/tyrosine transport system substrate-binding protein